MGGCGSSSSDNESKQTKIGRNVVVNRTNNNSITNKNNNIEKFDDNFKDFPIVEGEYYYGEGIKKIRAYKCDLAFDELIEKRKQFWNSRKSDRRIWSALKECCDTDYETALQLLLIAELACVENNLCRVIDMNTGIEYRIPNWVVSDVENDKLIDYNKIAVTKNKQPETKIEILLDKFKVKISNKAKGKNLKDIYLNEMKLSPDEYKVRIIHSGKEIKDDHELCYHDVQNQARLLVSLNKL